MSESIFGTNTQEKLASLDAEFNTNQGFGLMGMLEAQNQKGQEGGGGSPAPTAQPAPPKEDDNSPPEWVNLINTAVQGVRQDVTQQVGSLRQDFNSFRSQPAPVDMGDVDPADQRVNAIEQRLAQTQLNSAYERARNAMYLQKQRDPDFDYSDSDLQALWTSKIGANVHAAETSDFGAYFEQEALKQRAPRMAKQLEKLQAENAALKQPRNPVNDLSSVPRGNRNSSLTPPSSASQGDPVDDDIYNAASKRMGKGKFKGFHQALYAEQQRRLLRNAV